MAERVVMPNLGLTMDQGIISEWLKQEGESVEKDEPLLVVETDKAALEVPSPYGGVLLTIRELAGATVPVGQPIAYIGEAGEIVDASLSARQVSAATPAAPAAARAPAAAATAGEQRFISPRARRVARELNLDVTALSGSGPGGRIVERDVQSLAGTVTTAPEPARVLASPLAKKLALELGVDLAGIAGTGPGGRVTAEDVRAATAPPAETPMPAAVAATSAPSTSTPLGRIRRVTAERMAASAREVARVTLNMTVDMSEAVKFQAQLSPEFERRYSARLTYDAMIAKACALALSEHGTLNARWLGTEPPSIELRTAIHIGVAVAALDGLLVVVLRNAVERPLHALTADLLRLADLAREGKAAPDDLSGGTFTITNLGSYGVESFSPIVNLPEAAILGVGAITRQPAVVGDQIVIREQMKLSLSFDHRITDGAPAAAGLRRIREIIESPYILLT